MTFLVALLALVAFLLAFLGLVTFLVKGSASVRRPWTLALVQVRGAHRDPAAEGVPGHQTQAHQTETR